jgi:hypothetical protein
MTDVIETLASEGGKELVKALAAGLVEVVKKVVPALWRHSGKDAEDRMADEVERSAADLATVDADPDPAIRTRAEIIWETRLRDLLAAYPGARQELTDILAQLAREGRDVPPAQQNITANAPNAIAQGAMYGNVINYAGLPDRWSTQAGDDDGHR